MTPERLLIELRTLNIRVRVDGDLVRCKAPDGATIPVDLAAHIRTLKPQLLELLREEEAAIAWRRESGLLLEEPTARPVGACSYCGSKMPGRQTGRCVLCCLAAAQLVLDQLDSSGLAGHTTYPCGSSPDQNAKERLRRWDMLSDITEAT